MKHVRILTTLVGLTAGSLAGCFPATPEKPIPPTTQSVVPDSRSAATALLVEHTAQFNQFIAQMPGESGAVHRDLLVSSLRELSLILQLANGRSQSPEFTNRLSVIDAAAKTADDQTIPRPRMEAVETQAIQAAYKALGEIQSRYLFDDDQLPPMLDAIDEKADIAAQVTGPMHDLDSTEAFRAIQLMVQRITADMVERFGTSAAPADQTPVETPAVAPATAPTTAPATMP